MNSDRERRRIALPTSDRVTVDEHFGHAREFAFVDTENGSLVKTEFIAPPPHEPGVIPRFVGEQGSHVIITGGMGAMAVQLFGEQKIDVILGVSGTIEDIVAAYLSGELESTGSACAHHH